MNTLQYFKIFIYCITGTTDIGAEFGDVRPLDDARMRPMTVNGIQLLDLIDSNYAFLTELASPSIGCITWPQRDHLVEIVHSCLLYTSPSPRDRQKSRMPSSA